MNAREHGALAPCLINQGGQSRGQDPVLLGMADVSAVKAPLWHITWAMRNSRTSQRMIDYNVIKGEGIWIDDAASVIITSILAQIVRENGFSVLAFNICGDHVHLLLEASAENVSDIVKVLKSTSTYRYKQEMNIPPSETYHLWQQKFNRWLIASDEQFYNTMVYIIHNRTKHGLSENPELISIIDSMIPKKAVSLSTHIPIGKMHELADGKIVEEGDRYG